jgi:hypothetical protein
MSSSCTLSRNISVYTSTDVVVIGGGFLFLPTIWTMKQGGKRCF